MIISQSVWLSWPMSYVEQNHKGCIDKLRRNMPQWQRTQRLSFHCWLKRKLFISIYQPKYLNFMMKWIIYNSENEICNRFSLTTSQSSHRLPEFCGFTTLAVSFHERSFQSGGCIGSTRSSTLKWQNYFSYLSIFRSW